MYNKLALCSTSTKTSYQLITTSTSTSGWLQLHLQ